MNQSVLNESVCSQIDLSGIRANDDSASASDLSWVKLMEINHADHFQVFLPRLLCEALSVIGLPAFSAGFIVKGSGTPTPRNANPTNKPWLNDPTHYGSGASVHNFSNAASQDMLALGTQEAADLTFYVGSFRRHP
jgi:hypothetical protein